MSQSELSSTENLALPVQAVSIMFWKEGSPSEALLLAPRPCCPKRYDPPGHELSSRLGLQQLFLLRFMNVCICLVTPRLSYWGLSREEQCLNSWRSQPFSVNALDLDNTCWLSGFPPLRWGCSQSPVRMEEGMVWAGGGGRAPCRELLEFSHPAVIGLK